MILVFGVDAQADPGGPSSPDSPCPSGLSHMTLSWVGTPVLAPGTLQILMLIDLEHLLSECSLPLYTILMKTFIIFYKVPGPQNYENFSKITHTHTHTHTHTLVVESRKPQWPTNTTFLFKFHKSALSNSSTRVWVAAEQARQEG